MVIETGFPARAGMDPGRPHRETARTRIPRTRGDGPPLLVLTAVRSTDSPHARGWTHDGQREGREGQGFPARAGMDPPPPPCPSAARRIPRTRGDGPPAPCAAPPPTADSPHARGWTMGPHDPLHPVAGFPARAGMDRRPVRRRGGPRGIPRTRGDGPETGRARAYPLPDSPHARGWTLRRAEALNLGGGFPARAGMDPSPRRVLPTRARIPRTRGDGPRQAALDASLTADSPHARGWTVAEDCARCGGTGIPRTRGDGPRTPALVSEIPADSPHARGWTRLRGRRRPSPTGFPARAGMDPRRVAPSRTRSGIPRTRGDGPATLSPRRFIWLDSPHARGWTRASLRASSRAAGFPARAGMDLWRA